MRCENCRHRAAVLGPVATEWISVVLGLVLRDADDAGPCQAARLDQPMGCQPGGITLAWGVAAEHAEQLGQSLAVGVG